MMIRLFIIAILSAICFEGNTQTPTIDSLKKIIALEKKDVDEVKAYNLLAEEFIRQDVTKSRTYLLSAIHLGKSLQNSRTLSNSYSQMVTLNHNLGKIDSAVYYLTALKKLADENTNGDINAIKSNYYSTAGLFYKKTGNVKEAISFFKKSIALAEKMGVKVSAAGQLLNLGNVYMNKGDYKNALYYHLKALRIFEELGNKKGESFCYQSISISFIELKQYDEALKYANKSIALKTALNDKRGLGTSQSSLGQIYLGKNNYDKALNHFKAALDIAQEFKLVTEEEKIYFNIGKVYAAKKDINTANEYYNQTKALAKQLGDSTTIAAVDMELMASQTKVNKLEQSEKQLASSLAVFKNMGNLNKEVAGYKNLAKFYAANDQFEKALEYTNKYYTLNDSLESNELKLQMKKMEDLYTVEKKEKEIAILKKDQHINQQQLKQQQFLMIGSLTLTILALCGIWLLVNRYQLRQKMKELELRNQIAADLHDEVGSSLSSIHLLSQMAAQQGNTALPKDILERVSTNAHETMEKMSDIVWMIKPGENEGQSLIQRMQRFLYDLCTHQNIECSMNADELTSLKLTMHQRKNLYLIFKEAVNNAIKYSGTKKLDVRIAFQHGELVMHIKDYGKGFDEKIILKGNGLDNMQVRAKELKGNLHINSSLEKGTELNLTFPV